MDNSGITSPLKPQKDLDIHKKTHPKPLISHSPIRNGQINLDKKKINQQQIF